MTGFTGKWNIVMNTPMGERNAQVSLAQAGETLNGEMSGDGQSNAIENGRIEGDRGKWDVNITNPMPLTLSFDVGADGDNLEGTVKLGMFGNAPVRGTPA